MAKDSRFVITISKIKFLNFILTLFIIICLFFPADFYNLKKITFGLLIMIGINKILYLFSAKYRSVFFMALIFPLGTILYSMLLGSSFSDAFSSGYAGILFLLLIVVCEYNIDYESILIRCLKFLCYAIILIALLDFFNIYDVNAMNPVRAFIYENQMGVIGKSESYASYYKLFFKTSPLLIVLLYYSFEKKKWIDIFFCFSALVLSGTRGNIFVAFILSIIMVFTYETRTRKQRKLKKIFIGVTVLAGILLAPMVIRLGVDMMNASGSIASDAVRLGQLQGLAMELNDPLKILLGVGYGNSLMMDYGRGYMTEDFEWAYFSLLLKVGLIWFIAYMIFLIRPLFSKIKLSMKILHFGYMAITFTNPLLYSSTAMLMYIYIFFMMNKAKIEIQESNH